LLVLLVVVLSAGVLANAEFINEELSCEASHAVVVDGVAGGPSCTITFVCESSGLLSTGCTWLFDLSVNGTGQVSGTMTIEPIDPLAGSAEWTKFGPTGVEQGPPPECSGLFSCGDRSGSAQQSRRHLRAANDTLLTVRCSAGGLAAFEQVHCRLNRGASLDLGPIVLP
jgi:hypothetical protein